jgi:hypothetical protein
MSPLLEGTRLKSGRESKPPSRLGSAPPEIPVPIPEKVPGESQIKRGPGRPSKKKARKQDTHGEHVAIAGPDEPVPQNLQLFPSIQPSLHVQPPNDNFTTQCLLTSLEPPARLSTIAEDEDMSLSCTLEPALTPPLTQSTCSQPDPVLEASQMVVPKTSTFLVAQLPAVKGVSTQRFLDSLDSHLRASPPAISTESEVFRSRDQVSEVSALEWIGDMGMQITIQIMGLLTPSTKKIKISGLLVTDWDSVRNQILREKLGIPKDRLKKANLSCRFATFKSTPQQDIEGEEDWHDILTEMAKVEKERYDQKEMGRKRLTESKLPLCIEVTNPVSEFFVSC